MDSTQSERLREVPEETQAVEFQAPDRLKQLPLTIYGQQPKIANEPGIQINLPTKQENPSWQRPFHLAVPLQAPFQARIKILAIVQLQHPSKAHKTHD